MISKRIKLENKSYIDDTFCTIAVYIKKLISEICFQETVLTGARLKLTPFNTFIFIK